jgi:hypothetical protein
MVSTPMPFEFLHGRPLSPEELEMIRRGIEAFDDIGALSTTKYAVSWLATGRTCCPSFRPETNESRRDAVC